MENRLTGRLPFVYGTSLFYFYKEGKVQEFVHKLKYNRKAQVGEQLGREFGQAWQKSPMLEKPDLLIPIPLHPKREFKRGYNQSYMFAKGIAVVLDIPIFTKALKKTIHTESQTHKSREERIENIKESFAIGGNPNLAGKHILIVDDVLTTGATIEVFSKTLLAYEPNCRLSVGTIALAMTM
jgi:ComF family protein